MRGSLEIEFNHTANDSINESTKSQFHLSKHPRLATFSGYCYMQCAGQSIHLESVGRGHRSFAFEIFPDSTLPSFDWTQFGWLFFAIVKLES